MDSKDKREYLTQNGTNDTDDTKNIEKWSEGFLDFLKDSNYDKSEQPALRIHNLHNLFNLIYSPSCLNGKQPVNNVPPAKNVTDFMISKSLISVDSIGVVTIKKS